MQYSTSLLFTSLFATLFTLIAANGNLPGSCLANGTTIDPPGTVPYGGIYSSYCPSGYGRPQGVCNCVSGLNSCLANLAGCPGAETGVFDPPMPSVLYVGTPYLFTLNISYVFSLTDLCYLRPLPAGLNWVQLTLSTASGMEQQFAINGTPSESMPKADYGVAASRGLAIGGFSALFSFEIQSCSLADAVYPTIPPTNPPTSTAAPAASSSTPPSTTCTSAETGNMRCASTTTYQTCDHGIWQPAQSCGGSLVCSPQSSSVIYCMRPN